MPDTITLGFDTSAAHCAAALLRGDMLLASRHEEMGKGQAERLFPMLEEVLREAGIGWRSIDLIGVGLGPGNFTGVRVAVSAARGLSLSLNIPAVGVSATEATAFGLPRPCRIVLPSRRDQVIWQDFYNAVSTETGGRPQQAAADSLPPGPAQAPPAVPLAVGVAQIAYARRENPGPRPAPIYLRPADAAPSRVSAPVILP